MNAYVGYSNTASFAVIRRNRQPSKSLPWVQRRQQRLVQPWRRCAATTAGLNVGNSGSGSFNQTAGTNSTTSYLSLGHIASGSGSYSLNGGLLKVGSVGEYIGDNAQRIVQPDGRHQLHQRTSRGGKQCRQQRLVQPWRQRILAVPNLFVGLDSTGTFTQTGGAISVSSSLNLGFNTGSSGTYSLSGGSLAASLLAVGCSSSGTFNQSAGTITAINGVVLGQSGAGNGTYILSGGSLYASYITDGNFASGTFTQTGGTAPRTASFTWPRTPPPPARYTSAAADTFFPRSPSTSATGPDAAGHSLKPAARTPPQLPFCWVT